MNTTKISVLIPTRNEEKYISTCLDSVIANDYPKELTEIFVVDGESTDNTRVIVEKYTSKFPNIKLLINKQKTVPFALNLGINESTGEFIIRLDAHSSIPTNYFSELIKFSEKYKSDNIGTCCITDVKNKNAKTNSIKKVLSHKFGVGNSYFRIGIIEPREVDTVPFGCYRKEIFSKVGLFNENLTRNQDIELNKRIGKAGGKITLIPNVQSTYYARESYSEIAKNNFSNGLWNILTVYVTKNINSLSLRHFVPFLFLLSLILPLIGMIWFPPLSLITAVSLISYIIFLIIVSLGINDKTTNLLFIIKSFIVLHFSYGFGSLVGLTRLDFLFKKS